MRIWTTCHYIYSHIKLCVFTFNRCMYMTLCLVLLYHDCLLDATMYDALTFIYTLCYAFFLWLAFPHCYNLLPLDASHSWPLYSGSMQCYTVTFTFYLPTFCLCSAVPCSTFNAHYYLTSTGLGDTTFATPPPIHFAFYVFVLSVHLPASLPAWRECSYYSLMYPISISHGKKTARKDGKRAPRGSSMRKTFLNNEGRRIHHIAGVKDVITALTYTG